MGIRQGGRYSEQPDEDDDVLGRGSSGESRDVNGEMVRAEFVEPSRLCQCLSGGLVLTKTPEVFVNVCLSYHGLRVRALRP